MNFGEKLVKLRKEKGLSQEALAEKLNTTRQAISKWENGQGFPETEKLLMIANIFEVSIDYLLKESAENNDDKEDGYYVSREMAEGFLLSSKKLLTMLV
jgi:transcriptional regulator with XRE-family HTH domain